MAKDIEKNKEDLKQEKREAKRLAKEEKYREKLNKKNKFSKEDASNIKKQRESIEVDKNVVEAVKVKKPKKEKEKRNVKLAFKEFPTKMTKEVDKIKWLSSSELSKKFILVAIVLITFGLLFFGLDSLFSVIFKAAKVMG